jgi:hypothetical protein
MDQLPRSRTLGAVFGVCLAVVCLCLAGTGTVAAQSADIVVATDGSGNYTTIQTAIDNAVQNDIIEVRPGTYAESVEVDKDVTIVAPDGASIAPPSGAVSAVTITDASEPQLENLTITGNNRIGLDARSTTGAWTVTDLQITGVDFGITALSSTGEWVVDDTTIANVETRGISADGSEGKWTINSSTIRDVSGIGLDAYRIEAGVIKNSKITDVTQTGINLDDTGGDWVVENVTVENVGATGINAGDTNATHAPVIRDTTVVGTSDEGIDIAGSKSNVLITGTTVRNTGAGQYNNAIRIEDSVGDWTIKNSTIANISGEGIDAYNQPESSQATIRNLTVTDTQNHGVNFYNSSGDWEIIDSQISDSDRKGVEAGDTTGDWIVSSTTVETTNHALIGASGAAGDWEVHESELSTGDIAINATEAAKGNASYNYWGATDGPSGDFNGSGGSAVGNIAITPYYINSSLTTLSSEQDTGGEDVPEDPTQRALQITDNSDPSDLTQDDVTAVITRFNRGQSVKNIDIKQDDVTATITLFERN